MKYYIVVLAAAIIVTLFSVAQGYCEPRWTEWNRHCYRYVDHKRKNWTLASADCTKLSPTDDGHLITIDSADENKFASEWWITMLKPLQGQWQYIWTGLNDIDEDGTFVWSDGSPVTYTNWGGTQTDNDNGDCVTMAVKRVSDKGQWKDIKSSEKIGYMCEYTCKDC
ncbi:Alpha-N-acetylgalactosamine-specific lectin [Holothuria leucospilota]|uniref:Alpha-N-acetylgalactosamine-specific lectin n=1 Tax=Holothuria leucospilota TaxID=206669 RepID=A0A9Q1C9A6_HOLLE|nr:Alpha-N-acetylgalactosamine-specific lectin [Holothuria leucospilota]